MMIAFLISLVAANLLPATPTATTCGHWLDAATARDRVGWGGNKLRGPAVPVLD